MNASNTEVGYELGTRFLLGIEPDMAFLWIDMPHMDLFGLIGHAMKFIVR